MHIFEEDLALFAFFADVDPISFEEASKEDKWNQAMDQEVDAILRNEPWELVDLPKDKKLIDVKWVYKTKLTSKGKVDKHKARLVVKDYKHKYGVDFQEVFAS